MRAIEAARAFLIDRYRELVDPEFDFGVEDSFHRPSWRWVNEDLDPSDTDDDDALLLDPDVGVALFLLNFRGQAEEGQGTNLRAQVARGVGLRSRLLPRRLPDSQSDKHGGWRVVIHWFVDRRNVAIWRQQVSDLRRDTAHLDELPVDAIVARNGEWPEAIRQHGFPRLLLKTRRVLQITTAEELLEWSSADAQVARALTGFGRSFQGDLERTLAGKIEEISRKKSTPASLPLKDQAAEPFQLTSLSIRAFRNLRELDLHLDPSAPVRCAVYHGPNGTGKSNLFEALELALRGTSQRARDFLADKDVTTTKRAKEYLELYLRTIGEPRTDPKLRINGDEVSLALDHSETSPLSGNLLSQDDTHRFVEMPARELAAELLGGYSELAEELLRFTENASNQAKAELKAMLASLQLDRPGGITKPETARRKVAERELREAVHIPADVLGRLRSTELSWSRATASAMRLADGLQPDDGRLQSLSKELSKTATCDDSAAGLLRDFLMPAWKARAEVDAFLARLADMRKHWPENLARQVDVWSTWLVQRRAVQPTQDPAALATLEAQRQELTQTLSDLTRRGQSHKEREAHFIGVQSFIEGIWIRAGDDRCPTCDTSLRDRGGLLATVAAVREENAQTLSALRQEYSKVQQRLKNLDQRFVILGGGACPLSESEQEAVRNALAIHLPDGGSLDQLLSDSTERGRCMAWIQMVRALSVATPLAGDAEQFETRIGALMERLNRRYREMAMGFQRPEAWSAVSKALKNRLAGVVERHLPETLAGLWLEIAFNLTPAPWQIRGDLNLAVESRRGKQEARIRLADSETSRDPRLARYVLNRAEVRALGLAWFLVRYLTQGRFEHALLVMDDPALDMDQTTFRDLCRLLESLLRLHRVHEIPLTILLLLHQDERALDAARATEGVLHRLVWDRGDASVARSVKLYSEEYRHPTPESLFADARDRRSEIVNSDRQAES